MDKDMQDILIRVHTLGQECVIDYLKEEMDKILVEFADKKDDINLLLDVINLLKGLEVDISKSKELIKILK